MNIFADLLTRFSELFYWLYIVLPWEQALRIRAGKHVTKFGPGIYLKIPFIDIIYKQSTRIRAVGLDSQTATTRTGETITFNGSVRYRISDIEKMYQNVHNASDTVQQEIQGIITQYFLTHSKSECTPESILEHTAGKLNFDNFGFADVEFFLKDFALVKTYRFISGPLESFYGGEVQMGSAGV